MATSNLVPETVLAAVATDALTTELQTFSTPAIGPDDGLLQVEASAVCGTDWEIYGRGSRGAGLGPLILGHENVGRIAALGERAAERWGVTVGDRVAVEEFLPCGTCRLCRDGNYRICEATDSRSGKLFLRYGSTPTAIEPALFGGFGEYLYLHPRAIVYHVGEELSPELATLFVPVSNGIRWVVQEGGLQLGQTVVIVGPGQHGLGCVVAAREAGAGKVIVVGTSADADRLEIAKTLGANETIIAEEINPVDAVMDITSGRGADMIVDLVPGAASTIEDAIAMVTKRGQIVLAASKHGAPVSGFAHDTVVRKEARLMGVRGHDHRSVEPALDIIRAGRYPLELLCTHTYGLSQVDQALRMAGERSDSTAIHVSILPMFEEI